MDPAAVLCVKAEPVLSVLTILWNSVNSIDAQREFSIECEDVARPITASLVLLDIINIISHTRSCTYNMKLYDTKPARTEYRVYENIAQSENRLQLRPLIC